MKRIFLILTCLIAGFYLEAQIAYSPLVDSLKNDITEDGISELLEKLSGEVPVSIGGQQYTLETRHSNTSFNPLAAQWIYEQFEDMGLPVDYHYFDTDGENVVATITGSQFPDQQYIVCAHYDNMPPGILAPGADDNASGVVGVLETARLLKDYDLKYTVKFIAFDEEEQGLIGSYAYASEAAANGDDILGVLNLDMIAFDSDNDYEMSIATNTQSSFFTNEFTDVLSIYDFDLNYNYISTGASDHRPFWENGYQAILAIEDWYDFNDYYHTENDIIDNCNIPYFHQMVQAAYATMASHGMDLKMELIHDQLPGGIFTGDREAMLVVHSNHEIASGTGAPRLYYRVDGSEFTDMVPTSAVQDTFYFMIPAAPLGSEVDYYFGVQNQEGTFMATLPSGGRGIDPPGNIAPDNFFFYEISQGNTLTLCSNTLPKPILDLANVYDTIFVEAQGELLDVDVEVDISHTSAGNVEIYLSTPGKVVDLSIGNGGSGNNYSGTIFDDDASVSITQGSPPFTGTYQPEEPLSAFDGDEISGYWVIRIFDNALNDEGTLNNWCLHLNYSPMVNVPGNEEQKTALRQNFPNPFRDNTTFSFEISSPSNVRISLIDMMGRDLGDIVNRKYPAGEHQLNWNAQNLPQGRYFYRLQTDDHVEVKSMMIVK